MGKHWWQAFLNDRYRWPLFPASCAMCRGPVSHWIASLKEGDQAPAQPRWERYYRQLVALAPKKIGTTRRQAPDEEDVVQDAFRSFLSQVGAMRIELTCTSNRQSPFVSKMPYEVVPRRRALRHTLPRC